ncbi:hypothetical protein N9Y42_02290 [Mariniblastus sp.]|nr:hypothetical protein [Mariniblastus sp.]
MPNPKLNCIEAEPASFGQQIKLPNRDLGDATIFGWVLILTGGVGVLFMLGWISGPATMGINLILQKQWFGWLVIAFGMLGLGGLFFALKILAAGIAIVRNRIGCEIRITNRHVVSREIFGWFSHSIKVERKKIESLFLRPLWIDDTDGSSATTQIEWLVRKLPEGWHAIAIQERQGPLIAVGYPCEVLLPLSELIKKELDRDRVGLVSVVDLASQTSVRSAVNEPVEIVKQTAADLEEAPFELPADSTLEISKRDDATVYRVPEKGVWRGSHGLIFFALVWNGFLAFFTAGMLFGNGGPGNDFWIGIVVMSLFWAVGIAMAVGAFYLGRRSALVGAREGLLFIERKTIFGTKWMDFEPGKIASIHVGASNMSVNDKPVMELKIEPVGEAAIGMFSQLDDQELGWLAQQLGKHLDLQPHSPGSWRRYLDPENPLAAPDSSKVTVERFSNQTVVTIPKQNITGHWSLMLIGLVFAVGAIPGAIAVFLFFNEAIFAIAIAAIGTLTGTGMLLVDRIYSTRWFQIILENSKITIQRNGFLSERVQTISRENFKSVVLKDSGTKVNGQTHMNLAIQSRKSKENFTLMSGRDVREIAYVAAMIHHAIGEVEEAPKPRE